jgi:hypothetical protein
LNVCDGLVCDDGGDLLVSRCRKRNELRDALFDSVEYRSLVDVCIEFDSDLSHGDDECFCMTIEPVVVVVFGGGCGGGGDANRRLRSFDDDIDGKNESNELAGDSSLP